MSSTLITGAMSTADDRVRGWWSMNMSSGDRVLEPAIGGSQADLWCLVSIGTGSPIRSGLACR
jgi:hypothetical protein